MDGSRKFNGQLAETVRYTVKVTINKSWSHSLVMGFEKSPFTFHMWPDRDLPSIAGW